MSKNFYLSCSECGFSNLIKLKENVNKDFNTNFKEIEKILLHKGLPLEISKYITELSNKLSFRECSNCKINLCEKHQNKAINNAKCFNKQGLLCNQCSWYLFQV